MADQTKIMATRDTRLYVEPFLTGNALPADTVLWGTAWGGSWVDEGYTIGGLHFRASVQRTEIKVDQEVDPVFRIPTGRDMGITTNLAEITAAHIKTATGMGAITTVAAISGTRGHDDLVIGSSLAETYNSVGADVLAPDGEAFRLFLKKALIVGSPTIDLAPEAAGQIAFDAAALPDTSVVPTLIAIIRDVIPALP